MPKTPSNTTSSDQPSSTSDTNGMNDLEWDATIRDMEPEPNPDADIPWRATTPEEDAAVDAALGLTQITLRLPIDLLGRIDHAAQQEGLVRAAWLRKTLANATMGQK